MTDSEVEKLKAELEKLKGDVAWYKDQANHYGTLAVKLVKQVLVLERKYDRRFVYPEEYE